MMIFISRYWSNVPHYLQNHLSWIQQMTNQHRNFKEFRGLILTGWQRYDHFAILCETLPVGIPAAAISLQVSYLLQSSIAMFLIDGRSWKINDPDFAIL